MLKGFRKSDRDIRAQNDGLVHHLVSEVFGPLLRLLDPSAEALLVSQLQSQFELLRLRRQRRWNAVALQRIDDRSVGWVCGRYNLECRDHPEEDGVEFTICKMRANTHAQTCAICVVVCAVPTTVIQVPFWQELGGIFEMRFIVIGSPC